MKKNTYLAILLLISLTISIISMTTIVNAASDTFGYDTIGGGTYGIEDRIAGSVFTASSSGEAQYLMAHIHVSDITDSFTFGNTGTWTTGFPIEDIIVGQRFTLSGSGTVNAQSITAHIFCSTSSKWMNTAIYDNSGNLIASTDARNIEGDGNWHSQTFTFASPPTLTGGNTYILVAWSASGTGEALLAETSDYDNNNGVFEVLTYSTWPDPASWGGSNDPVQYGIYTTLSYEREAKVKGAIYKASDSSLIAGTQEATVTANGWVELDFDSPKPSIVSGTDYVLVAWADAGFGDISLDYSSSSDQGRRDYETYDGWPDPALFTTIDGQFSIYCYLEKPTPTFTSTITPTTSNVGATQDYTITITNKDATSSLGYGWIYIPSGFTVNSVNTPVATGGKTWLKQFPSWEYIEILPGTSSGAWTDPENAYEALDPAQESGGGSYAYSLLDGDTEIYSGFSFSLPPDATIRGVYVTVDAWTTSTQSSDWQDDMTVEISIDGTTWYPVTTRNLAYSESSSDHDVTSMISWTATNVDDIQVKVVHLGDPEAGDAEEIRLGYITVHVAPDLIKLFNHYDYPSYALDQDEQVSVTFSATPSTAGLKEWTTVAYDSLSMTTQFELTGSQPTVLVGYSLTLATDPASIDSTTGSGLYDSEDVVAITAPEYYVESGSRYYFDHWTSDAGGSFDDAYAYSTDFTMPASAVTVTAHYVSTQYLVTFQYSVSDSSSPTAPTVYYTKSGSEVTTTAATDGSVSDWVDAGTTVRYTNPLTPSGTTERWQTNLPIPTLGKSVVDDSVDASETLNPTYYHQYLVTFQKNVVGGSELFYPSANYTQYGGAATRVVSSSSASDWVDAGTAVSYTNPLVGSGTTQRWQADYSISGGKSVVDDSVDASETLDPTYYHQYNITFGYSDQDISAITAAAKIGSYIQFGSTNDINAGATYGSTSPASAWVDAGTGKVSYQTSTSTSGNERWALSSSPENKDITAAGTIFESGYYHQYMIRFGYSTLIDLPTTISGGPAGQTIGSYIQFGSSNPITPTSTRGQTNPASAFVDVGTNKVSYITYTTASNTERWALSTSPHDMNVYTSGTFSEVGYYHQYRLSIEVSGLDAEATTTDKVIDLIIRQFGSSAYPSFAVSDFSSPIHIFVNAHDIDTGFAFADIITSTDAGKRYAWAATTGTGSAASKTGRGGVFDLVAASTLRVTYKTQWDVTFSQTGIDSDAGSNTVLTVGTTDYAYDVLPSGVWLNDGTTFSWASPVSGGAGKQFVLDSHSGDSPISTAGTYSATYTLGGTQYTVSFTQTGIDSDAGSNTVLTVGSTTYAYDELPSSLLVDSGTVFSWESTVSGGTGKQFVKTGESGLTSPISASGTSSATYDTQFQVTFQYSVSDSSSPTAPTVYYTKSGSSVTTTAATDGTAYDWVDAGTTVAYTNPLVGSGWNEHWLAVYTIDSGQSVIDDSVDASETLNPTYYHQFLVTLEYNIANIPAGTPTVTDIVTYTSFGTAGLHATPALAPTDTSTIWADATTSVIYTNPIVSGNERWAVSGGASPYVADSSVTASGTLNPTYYHQYLMTFQYSVVGGGSSTAPTVYYTQFGSSATTTASTGTSVSDWVDAGTAVRYTNPLSPSGSNERWQANLAISDGKSILESTVFTSGTLSTTYYNQYLVTFGVTGLDGDATGTDTVVALTAKEFGSSTTPSFVVSDFSSTQSLFVDSGQSLGYTFTNIITSTAVVKQYAWASTSGTGSASDENTRIGSFTVSAVSSLSATYSAEYFTTVTYSGVYTGQYSDPVTLTATLTNDYDSSAMSGKTITFYFCKSTATYIPTGADILWQDDGTTDGSGVASVSPNLDYPSGTYKVFAIFAGDAPYLSSYDSDDFTVTKEDATVEYTGDTFVTTNVKIVEGEDLPTVTVRLAATVTQVPDLRDGDISLATVEFTISGADVEGKSFSETVKNVPVNSDGQVAAFLEDVPLGSYGIEVKIESSNLHWTSPIDEDVLLVDTSETGEGYVSGGGWIASEDSINGKINFGFVVHFDKRGNPKGSFVAVLKSTDGFNYRIKSTSWAKASLTFGDNGESDPIAYFIVTGVVQQIDRATGEVVDSWGNCKIMVDMTDGDYGENPNGHLDSIAITIVDNTNTILFQWGTKVSQIDIGNGNIVVASTKTKSGGPSGKKK